MPIQISLSHSLKYWVLAGVAATFFAVTASALAFGLSDEDYLYLATQKVEINDALIRSLWPAAGSVDTRLNESRLHFELHGT